MKKNQVVLKCQNCNQMFHRIIPIPESKEILCPKCKSNDIDFHHGEGEKDE